ncbi:hypothetical protein ACWIG4_03955 [Streptomyces sp. NPDC002248]
MRVFPYPRLNGRVAARVTSVRLRGPGDVREQLESKACAVVEQVVALGMAERDDWQSARLALAATLPTREMETKGHWTDVEVVAVLTEGATNARVCFPLNRVDGGREWIGELELDRDDYLDRASLAVHVVATVGGTPGRIIGSTDQDWVIDVTSDVPLLDRQLEVSPVSFARGAEWLRGFSDAPWAVDTSGRLPVVRVNSDFEGLVSLIEGRGSKTEAVLGEMLLAQMCAEVWTAVFHTAIGDVEVEDDGTPLFPPDWRGAVLREMLPDVVPGRTAEEALREVYLRRTGEGGWVDLQSRVQYAAARRAGVPKTLATTVRDIERINVETLA